LWNCWLRVNSRNLNRNMTLFCILVELGCAPQPRSGPCDGARYKGDDKGLSKYRQHRYCRQCLREHGDYGVWRCGGESDCVWHMDLIRSVTPITFEARNRVFGNISKIRRSVERCVWLIRTLVHLQCFATAPYSGLSIMGLILKKRLLASSSDSTSRSKAKSVGKDTQK